MAQVLAHIAPLVVWTFEIESGSCARFARRIVGAGGRTENDAKGGKCAREFAFAPGPRPRCEKDFAPTVSHEI